MLKGVPSGVRGIGFCCLLAIATAPSLCRAATCENVPDPSMVVQCGFAKPEDVQFIPSKSLVIISEQGWKAPESGGIVSAATVDRNHRLVTKRQLWPRASENLDHAHKENAEIVLLGDSTCKLPPNPDAFSPHGLAALEDLRSERVRVAVVGHGAREAIELFDLTGTGEKAELVWRGCVPLPQNTAGNDVAIHPDGRLFVTNYIPTVHDFRALLAMRKGARGEITGDVLEWSAARGWRHLPGTEMAIPNGVVLRTVSSRVVTLYVAESGRSRVVEFKLKNDGSVSREAEIAVDGSPDDLNWSTRGTLLAPIAKGDVPEWHLEEIEPRTRTARTILDGKTSNIHGVTSATDIGGPVVFGSMTDDKIATYVSPKRRP